MEQCLRCNSVLEKSIASISGSVMGDEYTDILYSCPSCGGYLLAGYHDHFMGEETALAGAMLDRKEGDRRVALIARCDCPWDKNCRCEAHREYFGGSLD
jgi:hypothetical protein